MRPASDGGGGGGWNKDGGAGYVGQSGGAGIVVLRWSIRGPGLFIIVR